MACRVGMSATPEERIKHWKKAEGYTQGSILATGLTYDEALAREKAEATARGCKQSGGEKGRTGLVGLHSLELTARIQR